MIGCPVGQIPELAIINPLSIIFLSIDCLPKSLLKTLFVKSTFEAKSSPVVILMNLRF